MVKKMDTNRDGDIDEDEFVGYSEQALPKRSKEFEVVVEQFMYVAKACCERKDKATTPRGGSTRPISNSVRENMAAKREERLNQMSGKR